MTNSRSRITQLSNESGASSGNKDGGAMDESDVRVAAKFFKDRLWNTSRIARTLGRTEATVYNALAKHREGVAHG